MEFPLKLRTEMRLRRLSQEMVAQRMAVSQGLVSGWCRGRYKPDIYQARALADVLELSLDYLLKDELDHPPGPVLTEDEQFIIRTVRTLGISADEAVRRLYKSQSTIRDAMPSPGPSVGTPLDPRTGELERPPGRTPKIG